MSYSELKSKYYQTINKIVLLQPSSQDKSPFAGLCLNIINNLETSTIDQKFLEEHIIKIAATQLFSLLNVDSIEDHEKFNTALELIRQTLRVWLNNDDLLKPPEELINLFSSGDNTQKETLVLKLALLKIATIAPKADLNFDKYKEQLSSKVDNTSLKMQAETLKPKESALTEADFIDELVQYLAKCRNSETNLRHYGRLWVVDTSLEIQAVEVLLDALKGKNNIDAFTDDILITLRKGELGKIIKKYEECKLLPEPFLMAENIHSLHHISSMTRP
ncbi:hypothetical protein ACNVED_08365 [Legionella sp. D16C41]|uniref:hypothetical protein n=1 Tax=Legionella sp. D16C41 TaxID=3402688 RepID=UPI003AF7B4D7